MTDINALIEPLATQLTGRAQFLRERGEVKSPQLMEEAAQALRTLAERQPVGDGEVTQEDREAAAKWFDDWCSAEREDLPTMFMNHRLTSTAKLTARIAELEAALEEIADPIKFMQARAEEEGARLDGSTAYQLANDPNFLKNIARSALEKRSLRPSASA